MPTSEHQRLRDEANRLANWKRWGPYLSERQWGTVREDYSANGDVWSDFTHEMARSRAYRWGEDGLLGWCDRQARVCFAPAFWNGKDSILKERLFGLTGLGPKGSEGNHAEDVKELYHYLDATPTHSYNRALYKYPQAAFPYTQLVQANAGRSLHLPEFEIEDTGVFAEERYFDIEVEYAKAGADDTLIQLTIRNRGPEEAELHVLPTLWFRNTWSWGCRHEGCSLKPRVSLQTGNRVLVAHENISSEPDYELGRYLFLADTGPDGEAPAWLFTGNETNSQKLYGTPGTPFTKDAFHRFLIDGEFDAVNPKQHGTKAAAVFRFRVPAGGAVQVRLRLCPEAAVPEDCFGPAFAEMMQRRKSESDAFYSMVIPPAVKGDDRRIARQAAAGLLWSKQFYHFIVPDWLEGDPEFPAPPDQRRSGRNTDWSHLYARDILSMPDKWEYPWFAAWDSAFHMLPFALLDPEFAKQQLLLFLREWYLHPNGQMPAYEFNFSDVNPPVHAWACWRVYKISAPPGERDREFLERSFQKLLLNFTWWVNRKDEHGHNLFSGGFLGLDNIGVFDRSSPLPTGGRLLQSDGTAWMAFYALTMMQIALELARRPEGGVHLAYEDMASKFFEHFVHIVDAMNGAGGRGLWDEEDGFYYDLIELKGEIHRLRTRSLVGLLPLIAVETLDLEDLAELPGFSKRLRWFIDNRPDLARNIACTKCVEGGGDRLLLSLVPPERLPKVLRYFADESEFLSPFGVRSLSRFHEQHPFCFRNGDVESQVAYLPGESDNFLFGGNSNWRGPIWFPINYLLIEALERHHHFHGESFQTEFPTGSGNQRSLSEMATEVTRRLCALFRSDASGQRPCHGGSPVYQTDGEGRELLLFHEFFHADSGRGLGASHQTGWTALIFRLLEDDCRG